MIKSILSGKETVKRSSFASVSIEISPEFGWPIENHRVFGPGTSIQGKK
jgi:hypothetical protein